MSLFAHYDPQVDIAFVRLEEVGGRDVVSEETDVGLRDVDADGRVVGLEVWDASARLPADLLALLDPPGDPDRYAARNRAK